MGSGCSHTEERMAVPRSAYADALARLSRRELLNIAWKLGAAAVIPTTSADYIYEPRENRRAW